MSHISQAIKKEMARVGAALRRQEANKMFPEHTWQTGPSQEDMDDLFRECLKGDPCGQCPRCATDERGYENG